MTTCNVNVTRPEETRRPEFLPAADIYERLDAYRIEASVPGADPETLNVQVRDGVLTLRASDAMDVPDGHRVLHRGFVGGDYVRSFGIPRDADAAAITARLTDGVLSLTLPKKAEARPHKVEVVAG